MVAGETVRWGEQVMPDTARRHRAAVNQRVTPAKIVVAGGSGMGKDSFIESVSDVGQLTAEVPVPASDQPELEPDRVPITFGRIAVNSELVLYLFGAPDQTRFQFVLDELTHGAVGAIVLVDTEHLAAARAATDFFEQGGMPYLVALNDIDRVQDVRAALRIGADIPVLRCDVTSRESTRQVLVSLLEHSLAGRPPVPARA